LAGLGLLGLVLVFPGAARGDESGGQLICLGRYALCSSAECQPIENEDSAVLCDCELPPEGLNVGNSTCQSRAEKLTSTFSLWDLTATVDKPAKRALLCEGEPARAWAFCLDSPCTRKGDGARCTCPLAEPSAYYVFVEECPASEEERAKMCSTTVSAAMLTQLLSGYSQLWPFYADIPRLEYCSL